MCKLFAMQISVLSQSAVRCLGRNMIGIDTLNVAKIGDVDLCFRGFLSFGVESESAGFLASEPVGSAKLINSDC